jgi:transposase
MEERLRFVARLLEGEAMTELCREFGISRKTGYKIFDRYKECGLEALNDRSRRPVHYANQLPAQIESLIVSLKNKKLTWGARKIHESARQATRRRCASARQEHHPCRARPTRPGQTHGQAAPAGHRDTSVGGCSS